MTPVGFLLYKVKERKEMLKMTRKQAFLHGKIEFNDNRNEVTFRKINFDKDRDKI